MRVAAVDIQGFQLGSVFIPKELSIRIGRQSSHFLLKPPTQYSYDSLYNAEKKHVHYVEKKLLGVRFSAGYTDYEDLNDIIWNHLRHIDYIYVRGHQKYDFLKERLAELSLSTPNLINMETFDNTQWCVFTFPQQEPTCLHHFSGTFNCTKTNVDAMYDWIVEHYLPCK